MAGDTQDKVYQVSAKSVGFAIAVLVAFFSSFPVANYFYPDLRAKAFTSDDGARHQHQIDELRAEVDILTAELFEWQRECEDRYNAGAVQLENHTVRLQGVESLITECLRRTQ